MDDLYAKESEDTPYDSQEVRFWSVKTMFKFLIVKKSVPFNFNTARSLLLLDLN